MKPPRRAHCRSLTLVEVVASLALLGGTIVGLLTAQARALQQLKATQRQRQAALLAEELVTHWQLCGERLAEPAQGLFEGQPAWSWTRSIEPPDVEDPPGLFRVCLEILWTDALGQTQVASGATWLEESGETGR